MPFLYKTFVVYLDLILLGTLFYLVAFRLVTGG